MFVLITHKCSRDQALTIWVGHPQDAFFAVTHKPGVSNIVISGQKPDVDSVI
jgi:uncharacterized protein with FMN-binding domain